MAVDHHGALDQLIGALQEVMAGDDAGVVDQQVHVPHLSTHLLGCGIHALPLSHVTHIGVDLRLEGGDLLHPSDRSCGGKEMTKVKKFLQQDIVMDKSELLSTMGWDLN